MKINTYLIGDGQWGKNIARTVRNLSDKFILNDIIDTKYNKDVDSLMKARDNISCVFVATPANTHYDIAKECLLKGYHTFIEKPMTTNSKDAKDLIKIADSLNLKIMVGHTFLYNNYVIKLKDIIRDTNNFGEILYIYSKRLNLGVVRQDVNVIWNLAPHDISIINYLLDDRPMFVDCYGINKLQKNISDVAFIHMEYGNKIYAHVHVSWIDPSKTREIVVVGSKKMVIYNDMDNESPIKIYDKGIDFEASSLQSYYFKLRTGDILCPHIQHNEPLKNEIEHFYQCIIDDQQPLTCGQNGLDVVSAIESINHALEIRSKWNNNTP